MQEVEYLEAAVEDMKIDSSLEEVKSEATDVAGNDNKHTVWVPVKLNGRHEIQVEVPLICRVHDIIERAFKYYGEKPVDAVAYFAGDELKSRTKLKVSLINKLSAEDAPAVVISSVQPEPQLAKPMKLPSRKTPSTVVLSDLLNSGLEEVPIYYRVFALELYNFYTQISGNGQTENQDISGTLHGVDVTVSGTSIAELWKRFQFATSLEVRSSRGVGILCPTANVQKCELTQTALLADALSGFFKSNTEERLFCLHQLPVYHEQGTPGVEAADFYAMSLDDSSCFTAPPIMLGDFKPSNIKRAYEETVAYI